MSLQSTEAFYDELAPHYHLIFDDWEASIHRQADIIASLLPPPDVVGNVLDCACGIGTQALALGLAGFQVDGCDISKAEINRAKAEAVSRSLNIRFWVDDMRELIGASDAQFGAIVCMDNSIPHLSSDEEILLALGAMRQRMRRDGWLLLSIRDYEEVLQERPSFTTPKFVTTESDKRVVFQVWDWLDERRYELHLHINELHGDTWTCHHSVGQYRAVTPSELAALVEQAGFSEVQVLAPEATGFYQPIVRAHLQA